MVTLVILDVDSNAAVCPVLASILSPRCENGFASSPTRDGPPREVFSCGSHRCRMRGLRGKT